MIDLFSKHFISILCSVQTCLYRIQNFSLKNFKQTYFPTQYFVPQVSAGILLEKKSSYFQDPPQN